MQSLFDILNVAEKPKEYTNLRVLALAGECIRPSLLLHAEEAEVDVGVLEQEVGLEVPHALVVGGAAHGAGEHGGAHLNCDEKI